MKTLKIQIADQTYHQIDMLVKEGWFPSREAILERALCQFLEANRPESLEKFVREDVDWGLRGAK